MIILKYIINFILFYISIYFHIIYRNNSYISLALFRVKEKEATTI